MVQSLNRKERKEEGNGQGKVRLEGWLVGFVLKDLRAFLG